MEPRRSGGYGSDIVLQSDRSGGSGSRLPKSVREGVTVALLAFSH